MTITASTRRREAIATFIRATLARFDGGDVVTIAALVLIAVGIGTPWGPVVAGGLLLTVTPIGTAIRLLIRGR